jgi:hypothetical protein
MAQALRSYESLSKRQANIESTNSKVATDSERVVCALRSIEKGNELTYHYGILKWCILLMYELHQNLNELSFKQASKLVKTRLDNLIHTAVLRYDISISRRLTADKGDYSAMMSIKQNYQTRFPDDFFYWVPRLDGKFDLYMFRQS